VCVDQKAIVGHRSSRGFVSYSLSATTNSKMKTLSYIILVPFLLLIGQVVKAQHGHHQMSKDTTRSENNKMDHRRHQKEMMHGMDSSEMAPMAHAFSLSLPMNRNGSGTGWLPDASPMYGYMLHSKKWMYMTKKSHTG
jgi:hypothetical protein